MRYRRLGRTGFMISEIVCGGDPIAPDNNRHVEAAIDFGLNYLDTAPTYGDGKSEEGYSVWEYTDEILADADERTKNLWTHGLAFLNSAAEREHGRHFEDCTAEQQVALVERTSQHEENPIQPEDRFFVAAKRASIDGCYTSAVGIHQDLRYQGNTALAEFPGCTHLEHKT